MNYCITVLGVLLYISEGISFSLIAPLFPTEALNEKGSSMQSVAAVIMSYDLMKMFGFIFASYILTPSNNAKFFCFGGVSSALLCGVFGCSSWFLYGNWFTLICLCTRSVQGFTSAFITGTGIPLFASILPEWGTKIASITEFSTGIGCLCGPVIASGLYFVGGFVFPFVVMAVIQIIIGVMLSILLYKHTISYPETEDTTSEQMHQSTLTIRFTSEKKVLLPSSKETYKSCSTFDLLSRPVLILGFFPTFTIASASGCVIMTLGPYLYDEYSVDSDRNGFFFLSQGVCFTLGAFMVGILAQRGLSFHLPLFAQFFASLGYSTFFLAHFFQPLHNQYLVLVVLAIEGLCHAASIVPAFYNLEMLAKNEGFTDLPQIRLTASPLIMLVFSLGRITGTFVTGGLIAQHFGIHTAFICVSLLIFLSWVLFWIPFCKFGEKRASNLNALLAQVRVTKNVNLSESNKFVM